MRKLFSVILLAASLSSPLLAQNDVKNRINEIKKSKSHIYGEATLITMEEAKDAAREILLYNIKNFIREEGDALQLLDVPLQGVVDSCEVLETSRGSMARALAFVKKSDFCIVEEDVAETDTRESSAGNTRETRFETAVKDVADLFILYNVLDSQDWSSCSSYGKVKQDVNPDLLQKSYLVIFKPDTYLIEAVLSPKKDDVRKNIATGDPDSTRNYPKSQALWVNLTL